MRSSFQRTLAFSSIALAVSSALAEAEARADDRAALIVHRSDDTQDCPDAAELAAMVARQMKRPSLDPVPLSSDDTSTRLTIGVQIQRSDEGYTALIEAGERTRTLSDSGPTCSGLADALAVTLAILLDTEPPPPSEPTAPKPPPKAAEAPPPAPPPQRRPSPKPESPKPSPKPPAEGRFGLSAGFGLAVTTMVLRPLSFAVLGDLDLRVGRTFSIAAGMAVFPTQRIDKPFSVEAPDTGADLTLVTGLVRACRPLLFTRALRAGPCLGLLAGAISAQGIGYPTELPAVTRPWVAATADAFLEQQLIGSFALVSRLSLLVPLRSEAFVVERYTGTGTPQQEELFSPSPLAGALTLEIRASIW